MKPIPDTQKERPPADAMPALRRAAGQARAIARRTGTQLVLGKDGHVEKRWLEGETAALREDSAGYKTTSTEEYSAKKHPTDGHGQDEL